MKSIIKVLTKSAEETKKVAEKFAKITNNGDIVLLMGDLGAGKTVFVKGFVEAFNIKDDVVSPTFTIMNDYGNGRIYHFDLYRLESFEEFEATGAFEQLYGNGISLVEWPERVGLENFPESVYLVSITKKGENEREILIARK